MLYGLPVTKLCVVVIVKTEVPPAVTEPPDMVAFVTLFPVTVTVLVIIISVVPVFKTATVIVVGAENVALVIDNCSVSMNVNVIDPIHAATAMETATVTAMSMMAATTGLRAFLLFRSFLIFCSFPPLVSQVN